MIYILGIIVLVSVLGLFLFLYPLIKTRNNTSKTIREKGSNNLIDLNKVIITIASAIIAISVNIKISKIIMIDLKDVWISFLCCVIFGVLAFSFDYIRKIYDELLNHSAEELFSEEKNDKDKLTIEFKLNIRKQAMYQVIVSILVYLQFVTFISGMIFLISKGLEF
jgi:hypothetical protein